MSLLAKGQNAPAWSLLNQDGLRIDQSNFAGHYLVFWWYPKADTPG